MKRNSILSLILSVMMVFTLVFQTGVFAEEFEVQPAESETEEIVADIVTEKEAVLLATEQVAAEEAAQPQPEQIEVEETEEEPASELEPEGSEESVSPSFAQGYVCVKQGTAVYENESTQNRIGSFYSASVAYAVVTSRSTNEVFNWLRITFDTAAAKEADKELLNGYVQFKDVEILTDEAVDQLVVSLKHNSVVRSYGDKPLPTVSFVEELTEEEISSESFEDVYAAAIPAIEAQPQNQTVASGETVTFTVQAKDATEYQWQIDRNDGKGFVDQAETTIWKGTATDTLSFTGVAARKNFAFRVVVKNAYGEVTSEAVRFTLGSVVDGVTYVAITTTTCKAVSYSGSAASLVIPETVNNMTVTEIGEEAFMDNKSLVSIDLPDTVTVIRARAFKNCSNLSEMK